MRERNNVKKIFLMVVACSFLFLSGVKSQAADIVTVGITGNIEYDQAREVLNQVNQERSKAGKEALQMTESLQKAAMKRAAEIAIYYSHTRPDGSSCMSVIEESYGAAGENIAAGYQNASAVMQGWMNSTGHRNNILNQSYKAIGVGCFYQNGVYYWVQLFSDRVSKEASASGKVRNSSQIQVLKDYLNISLERYTSYISGNTMLEGKTDYLVLRNQNQGWKNGTSILDADSFVWSVDDPTKLVFSVVTKEDQEVLVKQAGSVVVTARNGSCSVSSMMDIQHDWSENYTVDKSASCTQNGIKSKHCNYCNTVKAGSEISIPLLAHQWTGWNTKKEATALEEGQSQRTCISCQKTESQVIPKLRAKVKLNYSSLKIRSGQSTSGLKVSSKTKGDVVRSWKSSRPSVLSVNSKTGKLRARKFYSRPVTVTVTMKSGAKASCKVKIQKTPVSATSLTVNKKQILLKKGKSFQLKTTVKPVTCISKATFESKNKKVASVSSKGRITAKGKGSTTIIVRRGGKRVLVKVRVR